MKLSREVAYLLIRWRIRCCNFKTFYSKICSKPALFADDLQSNICSYKIGCSRFQFLATHMKCTIWKQVPSIYLLKVNNRNTRRRCEICSKLTMKTPEWHHWRRSGEIINNSEHTSHLVLVFLLLTLSR